MRSAPRRPFLAVLGGAKRSATSWGLSRLSGVVDRLVIGGGMCFTFLKALGNNVGDSLCEDDQVGACKRIIDSGAPILLPTDITALSPEGEIRQMGQSMPEGWKGLDIGPGSAAEFGDVIHDKDSLLEWSNGIVRRSALRGGAHTRAIGQSPSRLSGLYSCRRGR